VALLLLATPPVAQAKTYHAGGAGCSDSGQGTSGQPFCTLAKAAAGLQPGDVLELDGTFSEQLVLKVSGTRSKPIVIQAASGAKPVIDGSKLTFAKGGLIQAETLSYVTIKGITLKGSPNHCLYCSACKSISLEQVTVDGCKGGGLVFDKKSAKVTVRKCDVKATGRCAKDCGVQGAIMLGDSSDFEVVENKVHDTIKEGIVARSGCSNGTIHHNTMDKTGAAGVMLNHAFALRVYRNKVKASAASGFMLAVGYQASGTPETTNNHLFQNEVTGSKAHGIVFTASQLGDLDYNEVYNNVFHNSGGWAIKLDGADKNTLANNILMQNTKGSLGGASMWENDVYNSLFHKSGKSMGENPVNGDPLFVDPANGDFTLQEESPAIDAGYEIGLAYQDKPDIGAHEYVFESGCSVAGDAAPAGLALILVLALLIRLMIRAGRGRGRACLRTWLVLALALPALACNQSNELVDTVPSVDLPSGVIDTTSDQITIKTGEAVYFTSKVYCPDDATPCTFKWDFGDGQTSTQQDPGKHVYKKAGFYKVTLLVTGANKTKDPKPSVVQVTAWNGTFKDDFNRAKVEYDKYGWRRPLLITDKPMYDIQKGWLHITGEWGLPGSTGILAWPQVKNFHLEVTKRRETDTTDEHYSDVIVRMHPSGGTGQFYRVRIWEENAPDSGIEIAIFKIMSPDDEHGYLLNDPSQPQSTKPTQCKLCPYKEKYPRTKDLRIIVDVQGATIKARIEDPKVPGVAVLTSPPTTDTIGAPYLYAGAVGLTHFEGISYFDDFVLKEDTKAVYPDSGSKKPDAGKPDGGGKPDAGAADGATGQ